MNIAIDPECWLLRITARLEVGHRDQPDVASLIAFPDRLQPDEIGILLSILFEKPSQFRIAIELIEANIRHAILLLGIKTAQRVETVLSLRRSSGFIVLFYRCLAEVRATSRSKLSNCSTCSFSCFAILRV